jgi:hypothetical protein
MCMADTSTETCMADTSTETQRHNPIKHNLI